MKVSIDIHTARIAIEAIRYKVSVIKKDNPEIAKDLQIMADEIQKEIDIVLGIASSEEEIKANNLKDLKEKLEEYESIHRVWMHTPVHNNKEIKEKLKTAREEYVKAYKKVNPNHIVF